MPARKALHPRIDRHYRTSDPEHAILLTIAHRLGIPVSDLLRDSALGKATCEDCAEWGECGCALLPPMTAPASSDSLVDRIRRFRLGAMAGPQTNATRCPGFLTRKGA